MKAEDIHLNHHSHATVACRDLFPPFTHSLAVCECPAVMNRNISITLLLFLISIMNLSICFPPNYYSYPFCTAHYGLTIFRTITRTVLSKTLTVFSNAHLLT